jgi:hypothetical protein
MQFFDFLNAINENKKDLFEDPQASKDYKPWLVNNGLSYFPDTIMYSNEMNRNSHIPNEWQFRFLLNSIPKKKRFSKWAKKEAMDESLELVKEYYGYSYERTKEILNILSPHQLRSLQEKLKKGGKNDC